MISYRRRYQLAFICILVALLLTACFRDTSEVIEQQPVARELATSTPLPALEPTAVPATATEEPIAEEQPADNFALSATALIALQTEPANEQGTTPNESEAQSTAAPVVQLTLVPLIRVTVPPGEDCVHEIRFGDTLFQLALAYGVTVEQISIASGIINPDVIDIGQRIIIPQCGTTGFAPPPTSIPTPTVNPNFVQPASEPTALELADTNADVPDETVSALAEQAQAKLLSNAQIDVSTDFSIQSANLPVPSRTYTMKEQDTLLEVAAEYGTTVEMLAALNNIDDIDNIQAGTVLKIP